MTLAPSLDSTFGMAQSAMNSDTAPTLMHESATLKAGKFQTSGSKKWMKSRTAPANWGRVE